MDFGQWTIMICGIITAWLQGCKNQKVMRWWFFVALIAEPYWIYTTWLHEQYGMLILTIWFTFAGILRGIYNNWIKKEQNELE